MIKTQQKLLAISRKNQIFLANYRWKETKQIKVSLPVFASGTKAKLNVSRVSKKVYETSKIKKQSQSVEITKPEAQQQVNAWLAQGATIQHLSQNNWVIYNPNTK